MTGGAQGGSGGTPPSTRKVPRFAGVSTFLRLAQQEAPDGLDVMVCGAPFDGGTTFRPGARFGPRAVREASALTRGYQPALGRDVFQALRCADGGDIACVPMRLEQSLDDIRARVGEIARAGAVPAIVGGDHTVSLGVLRGLAEVHGPLGLVHFDAHSDTFGPAWGVDLHHGTVFRHAAAEGLLRPDAVLQIGIRGPFTAAADVTAPQQLGFQVIDIDAVKADLPAVAARIAALAGQGPFHVSFDMDAVDPAYAPGTGTPVPGGLTSYEALRLLRALGGVSIVGMDVVEISPDHDPTGITSLLAVSVLAELLGALAVTRGRALEAKP
jgi:agmatinase